MAKLPRKPWYRQTNIALRSALARALTRASKDAVIFDAAEALFGVE